MKVKTLSALAGLGGALIMSGESQAAYTGLSVELHTTVLQGATVRSVYRVYANFTRGDDLVFSWNGPTTDPISIESRNALDTAPGSNFFNPGGPSAGSTAPSLAQINGNKTTPAVPNIQWGTYATIGVNIADQGSGPTPDFPAIDQTALSPGFPDFITGNSFNAAGAVFAAPQAGTHSQGRADYAPDGDLLLRVQLMQLTVNAGDNVRGNLDLAVQLQGSGSTVTFEDQTFNSIPAPGALALLGLAGLVGTRRRRA
jgi:hypothetical protein